MKAPVGQLVYLKWSKGPDKMATSTMNRNFDVAKRRCLGSVDLSRKGSIDFFCRDIVEFINSLDCYFTTSSCSGRIIVFQPELAADSHTVVKSSCKWIFVSHQSVETKNLEEVVYTAKHQGDLVFKFEPFILHVQCRTIQDAQNLHRSAIESGFRNSGMSVGKSGKIIQAVRSTHGLEVPLTKNGSFLVGKDYVRYLVECANLKMEENEKRLQRFYQNIQGTVRKDLENQRSNEIQCMQCGTLLNTATNKKEPKKHKNINKYETSKSNDLSQMETKTERDPDTDAIDSLSILYSDT